MFATDRDLLALEPNLFRDVGWVGQRLIKGTGDIAGTTLTLTAQDADFLAAGVAEGYIALVDGTPYEIIQRLSSTTAEISRLRAAKLDPVLPPSPATAKPVVVTSFRPQIAIAHAQVLRMLGIEPDDPGGTGRVVEEDITNPSAIAAVEALGALYLAFAAAAGPGADARPAHEWSRTLLYKDRFAAARQRTAAQIDLDGDGLPDATRRMNIIQFVRG